MKFAKYLQNTETSEWKNAYIDYRGLKKRIRAIQLSRKNFCTNISDSDTLVQRSPNTASISHPSQVESHADEHSLKSSGSLFKLPSLKFSAMDLSLEPPREIPASKIPSVDPRTQNSMQAGSFDLTPSIKGDKHRSITPPADLSFHELLTQFTPQEFAFFAMLDEQLDKVDSFYLEREKEMISRGALLLNQLEGLQEHQKMFLETRAKKPWSTTFFSTLSSRIRPQTNASEQKEGQTFEMALPTLPEAARRHSSSSSIYSQNSLAKDQIIFFASTSTLSRKRKQNDPKEKSWTNHIEYSRHNADANRLETLKQRYREENDWNRCERSHYTDNPDDYIRAKRKLKRAVLEHYRGLETLYNYRVLNITGFRKAVKKFEKTTKIPVQNKYMTEKVNKSAFASNETVRNMTREMEQMYATAFARGDKKKALERLRTSTSSKTHHFSTFRSGLLIGLAIYALIDGLEKVFQPETQQAIPYWDILLFLYELIFVPVLYSFLVGFNLLVWAKSRINYVFIFDLDSPSRLDYRQYFEIPSLLLGTLCFTFWLSFSRIGAPNLQPSAFLLLWLIFVAFLMVNPTPVMAKSSRFWLTKNILKLFLSGFRPVEFADFWLGDQFCSFTFPLSNGPLFVCVYLDNFSNDWAKCKNSSRTWPIAFGLATIPFIIRLIQSVKRYVDSKLVSHIINAGKYGTGIVSYLFYFMWSYQPHNRGTIFALWCVFNTCYSTYACAWDYLVDYSVLQPHSKHVFLRTNLLYDQWVYYVAMLFNLIIRFTWVIYIPQSGPAMMVRTFITGMLEMLRRILWNFYRLENEHLGNMDQYRVTREMPLPYTFDFETREGDHDDYDILP